MEQETTAQYIKRLNSRDGLPEKDVTKEGKGRPKHSGYVPLPASNLSDLAKSEYLLSVFDKYSLEDLQRLLP